MKLSKDELLKKISEKVLDEDVQIELLEDISDSFKISANENVSDYEEIKKKYEDLKVRYKERFLGNSKEDEEEEEEEEEEKKIVDVKEI